MPLNYNNGSDNNSNLLNTFNDATYAIRHSNNKNDAIRTLSSMKISGTDTTIGNRTAHQIYDKYAEYTGYRRR